VDRSRNRKTVSEKSGRKQKVGQEFWDLSCQENCTFSEAIKAIILSILGRITVYKCSFWEEVLFVFIFRFRKLPGKVGEFVLLGKWQF